MNPLLFVAALLPLLPIAPAPSYKAERIALLAAAVADIATTRNAIIKGSTEANPLLTPLVGKTPSTLKLIGVKVVGIGVVELAARYHRARGEYSQAKFLYWLTTIVWAYVSGLNLSWQFK